MFWNKILDYVYYSTFSTILSILANIWSPKNCGDLSLILGVNFYRRYWLPLSQRQFHRKREHRLSEIAPSSELDAVRSVHQAFAKVGQKY
jgi:hypothetical protein